MGVCLDASSVCQLILMLVPLLQLVWVLDFTYNSLDIKSVIAVCLDVTFTYGIVDISSVMEAISVTEFTLQKLAI